jgi:predicted acylesterase/phospholipase RssA/CRP-like cAMP-binding protein
MDLETIKKTIADVFNIEDDVFISHFVDSTDIINVETGEYIFHEGDLDDYLYIVLSGRLRAIVKDDLTNKILGDIATGQPVGEFAFFSKEPRSASVIAMRKSKLLRLSQKAYLMLIKNYPEISHMFSKFVLNRLKNNSEKKETNVIPKNIAFVIVDPSITKNVLFQQIKSAYEQLGIDVQAYFHDSVTISNLYQVFEEIDGNEGLNLLVCDDNHDSWADHCISNSDAIVIVSQFSAPKAISHLENRLKLHEDNILNRKKYLLLIHENGETLPVNTVAWLKNRNVEMHIHLRLNQDSDFRRFCRISINRAIGIVLGGGGAKGFAHIGAVKALNEKGIEIDFLGGTSSGALYGIGLALFDFDYNKSYDSASIGVQKRIIAKKFVLPMISILSNKELVKYVRKMYGDMHFEDLWINCFCISTNYTDSKKEVHNKGLVWLSIAASIAIPGIFPPVVIQNKLHIDGGVMDNLPIETMQEYPIEHIIAIALSGVNEKKLNVNYLPSHWTLLWDKISRQKKYHFPGLASLIINSSLLHSNYLQKLKRDQISLYIELELRDIALINDKKWKEAINKGYSQVENKLKEIVPFWKK